MGGVVITKLRAIFFSFFLGILVVKLVPIPDEMVLRARSLANLRAHLDLHFS
jgi:hypothetical protein